jgi:membrane protein implicated in regulation of membrane protease activity
MAIVLYVMGTSYLAIAPVSIICGIFAIEATEVIHLENPDEKQVVGSKCSVVRQISKTERGVVKLLGMPDWELWSAESDIPIGEGNVAFVSGIKGITLQVKPLKQ